MSGPFSATVREIMTGLEPVLWFVNESTYAREGAKPGASDFCFGNPHEMPLPEISQAISRWAQPKNKDWFAYKFSEKRTTEEVAASLRARLRIDFEAADIAMTNGAFGAIAAALRALVDAGDEVIYLSPPWFFYVPMIASIGARAVRVDLRPPDFALPVDDIAAAITPRTRAIIVNSPHNPSGRILQPDELARLADVLEAGSRRHGRAIYLLSDEAYSRILFDSSAFHTPLNHYSRSLLLYTYGKTLLTPGQRMGYIAMPPTMPERSELRSAIFVAQMVSGYAFPNNVMQYALGDLEKLSVDVNALQRRRDRIVPALREMGYEALTPAGTFYVLVRSPVPDDLAFTESLARENVFVLPGKVFELPGWFRISLTANDEMVERALPVFERVLRATLAAYP
ncbi:MAG TPA: aminotransferase class I/II-fold pyridoxal phosphate-dependent enzyme [Candidatus Dormibacteraeota bacterium]|nr:aminotransferase class I/II-fold pyridoxal phosphate-dependent enzyme [Candidatus Dormibacteraeota bacterium]